MESTKKDQSSADQTQKRLFVALCFSAEEREALAQSRAGKASLRASHPHYKYSFDLGVSRDA